MGFDVEVAPKGFHDTPRQILHKEQGALPNTGGPCRSAVDRASASVIILIEARSEALLLESKSRTRYICSPSSLRTMVDSLSLIMFHLTGDVVTPIQSARYRRVGHALETAFTGPKYGRLVL